MGREREGMEGEKENKQIGRRRKGGEGSTRQGRGKEERVNCFMPKSPPSVQCSM